MLLFSCMKSLQEKSQCCAAEIIRYGGKRRQCVACRKTWRVHPAKRGRKASRGKKHYLEKVFNQGFTVKQLAAHSSLSRESIYKKFRQELNVFTKERRIIRIRGSELILVIDAQWQIFNDEYWTLYCLAVKAVGANKVTVFDPILMPGKECATIWNTVIAAMPVSVKKRIIAVVSDGLRGFDAVANNYGWVIQRCHFHLLSSLQKMRGKRASTPGRLIKEEIYQITELILAERSQRKLNNHCRRIANLAHAEGCPIRMRMRVREMLRHLHEFRNYLNYPEFRLPTTTNVMESINSLIRRRARTVNSPRAWHKWATATVRFKSKFTCQ